MGRRSRGEGEGEGKSTDPSTQTHPLALAPCKGKHGNGELTTPLALDL